MAKAHIPEEFFERMAHHLPPEEPVGHRAVVRVIWFVPATGCRWEDVPSELGCSGRTAHRRLRAWEEAGIWDRPHADLLRRLRKASQLGAETVIVDSVTVRAFGDGEDTSASPVDRAHQPVPPVSLSDPARMGSHQLLHVDSEVRVVTASDRVASGRCRPEAPTDPYVLALEHTVPQIRDSLPDVSRTHGAHTRQRVTLEQAGGDGPRSSCADGCGA